MELEFAPPAAVFLAGVPAGPHVVHVTEELDVGSVGTLRGALTAALESSDDVRVDLSPVRTIDSTVIRELLRAQALAARTRKTFGVTALTSNVRRLLVAADAAGLMLDRGGPVVRDGLAPDGAG